MPSPSPDSIAELIRNAVANIPAWDRIELAVKEPSAKARAKEVLAAMIDDAIRKN